MDIWKFIQTKTTKANLIVEYVMNCKVIDESKYKHRQYIRGWDCGPHYYCNR